MVAINSAGGGITPFWCNFLVPEAVLLLREQHIVHNRVVVVVDWVGLIVSETYLDYIMCVN
jgi:hypothetical protein